MIDVLINRFIFQLVPIKSRSLLFSGIGDRGLYAFSLYCVLLSVSCEVVTRLSAVVVVVRDFDVVTVFAVVILA